MAAKTTAQAGSTVASQNTDGDLTAVQLRTYRHLIDGLSTAAVTTSAADWGYASLTPSGNTTVKTGSGQLFKLIVGTATGNISIYDATSATNGNTILATCALPVAGVYVLELSFLTALFIVLSGAGVATVTFR